MPLPQPDDLTSLVLRTDFGDEGAWDSVRVSLDAADEYPHATCVSELRFADMGVQALMAEEVAADEDEQIVYMFLADAVTMKNSDYPLLAVDLSDEPGRTFRVPARWFPDISANLGIADMDFAEFADAADGSGTFTQARDRQRQEGAALPGPRCRDTRQGTAAGSDLSRSRSSRRSRACRCRVRGSTRRGGCGRQPSAGVHPRHGPKGRGRGR